MCVFVLYFLQIALNGLDEYRGGGTFFPSLGRALRPAEGHALSFRGSILHGGDPILAGVRYIIACFCYADNGDCNNNLDNPVVPVERGTTKEESVGRNEGEKMRLKTEAGVSAFGGGVGVAGGNTNKGVEFGGDHAFSFGFSL